MAGSAEKEPKTYEEAARRLEEIIERLDSGGAQLRETLELVGEGKALIEFCKGELDAVSGDLRELQLEDLVASLEPGTADESERDAAQ